MATPKKYPPESYIFACPSGCQHSGQRAIAATLRGWKKHMTHAHGGYTAGQLIEVASQTSERGGASVIGAGTEDEFAASLPQDAQAAFARPAGVTEAEAAPSEAARKLRIQMNKLKKRLAKIVPATVSQRLVAACGPACALSDDESDMIIESLESLFDALGLSYEIEPWNVTLKSKLWLLLYPVGVIGGVAALKILQHTPKKGKDDSVEPDNGSDRTEG